MLIKPSNIPMILLLISVMCASINYAQVVNKQSKENSSTYRGNSDSNQTILQYVKLADAVVTGRVISSHSYWKPDSSVIITDYVIKTTSAISGGSPDVFTITAEGGEVGDVRLDVSDEINLTLDHEYLMLLKSFNGKLLTVKSDIGVREIDSQDPKDQNFIKQVQSVINVGKEQ